jgi:hypothetical protein
MAAIILICLFTTVPYFPIIVADGSQERPSVSYLESTFFVVCEDFRTGNWDIYGTPVSLKGEVMNPEGIPLITEPSVQSYPSISAGTNYFLLLFSDDREAPNWPSLYYAKLSPSGEVLDPGGVLIYSGNEPDENGWGGVEYVDAASVMMQPDIFLGACRKTLTWWMEANTYAIDFYLNPVTNEGWNGYIGYPNAWGGCPVVARGMSKCLFVCDDWLSSFGVFIYDINYTSNILPLPDCFYTYCGLGYDNETKGLAYGEGDFFLLFQPSYSNNYLMGAHIEEENENLYDFFPIDWTTPGEIGDVSVVYLDETGFCIFWERGGVIYSGYIEPFSSNFHYHDIVAFGVEPRAVSCDGEIFLVWQNNGDIYGTLLAPDLDFLFPCGDVNSDRSVNALDLSFLANFCYAGGPSPIHPWTADLNNCDGNVDQSDLVSLADYLMGGGIIPRCCSLSGEPGGETGVNP